MLTASKAFCICAAVGAALVLLAQPVMADVVGVAGNVQVKLGWWNPTTSADQYWTTLAVTPDAASGDFAGKGHWANSWCDVNWDVQGNIDPVVNGVFAVTNNSLVTQTMVMSVILPLGTPILPSSMTSGVINVTVVDNTGDGATLAATPANAIYRALIDSLTHQTLLVAPTSVVAAAYNTANTSASFGLPGQTVPGPAALTDIGLTYRFTLTPGDSATVNGNFVVIVPEPATAALVLLLAPIALRRTRH